MWVFGWFLYFFQYFSDLCAERNLLFCLCSRKFVPSAMHFRRTVRNGGRNCWCENVTEKRNVFERGGHSVATHRKAFVMGGTATEKLH